jgi:hypothetical protein
MIPAIDVDSNNHIYVVWYDETPGNNEIYFSTSIDGGSTWTQKRLTYNSGGSFYPDIAVDSNNHIHVVWLDDTSGNNEIYYKKSTSGGATWARHKRLTWNSGNSSWPRMAIDSNSYIHVVWHDDTPGQAEIFYKRSTKSGTTWTTRRLTHNSGDSWFPSITTDSDNSIHLAWRDETPGNAEIYYKKGIQ